MNTKSLSLSYLSTQSMSSTCGGFYVTLQQNQLGNVIPSETWLQDNRYLLEYDIPGYKFVYKDVWVRWSLYQKKVQVLQLEKTLINQMQQLSNYD